MLADASVRPSGEKATDSTGRTCPRKEANSFPVLTSHSLTVRSSLAVPTLRPSGEKATPVARPP
jgi:hypothetical protein